MGAVVNQGGGLFRIEQRRECVFRRNVAADGHSLPQQPGAGHLRTGLLDSGHENSATAKQHDAHEADFYSGHIHGASGDGARSQSASHA